MLTVKHDPSDISFDRQASFEKQQRTNTIVIAEDNAPLITHVSEIRNNELYISDLKTCSTELSKEDSHTFANDQIKICADRGYKGCYALVHRTENVSLQLIRDALVNNGFKSAPSNKHQPTYWHTACTLRTYTNLFCRASGIHLRNMQPGVSPMKRYNPAPQAWGTAPIEFIDQDSPNENLDGEDLRNANLKGSRLRRSSFRNADLRGATLFCDLSYCDFTGANLDGGA